MGLRCEVNGKVVESADEFWSAIEREASGSPVARFVDGEDVFDIPFEFLGSRNPPIVPATEEERAVAREAMTRTWENLRERAAKSIASARDIRESLALERRR